MKGAWFEQGKTRWTGRLLAGLLAAAVGACGGESPTEPGGNDGGEGPEPLPGSWSTAAALPLGLADGAVTVHDGRIFVAGGRLNDSTATARTHRYDPAANAWERLSDLPETLAWSAAGVHDGRIMIMGGNAGGDAIGLNPRSAVRVLDASEEWSLHSGLPEAAVSPRAITTDEGVWVIELGSFPSFSRGTARLAPGASEWTVVDEAPPVVAEFFVGDGDLAWAVGFQSVSEYRDGAWTEAFSLPEGFLIGAWALEDRLYVLTRQATRARMRVWDGAARTWVPLAAPEEAIQRTEVMTATVGGRLYLIGGREATPGGGSMTRVDVFTPPS